VAEGARLESVYTARYPGFESLSLRHQIPQTQQNKSKTLYINSLEEFSFVVFVDILDVARFLLPIYLTICAQASSLISCAVHCIAGLA
jgi:hypothetical protein